MKTISLTDAEWEVMECLWDHAPQTGREVVSSMKEKMGWARTTTLTVLSRLEGKGAVASDNQGKLKQYKPVILREEAAAKETETFLQRVYEGSLGMMVSSLTKSEKLTQKDVDELYSILKEWEGK